MKCLEEMNFMKELRSGFSAAAAAIKQLFISPTASSSNQLAIAHHHQKVIIRIINEMKTIPTNLSTAMATFFPVTAPRNQLPMIRHRCLFLFASLLCLLISASFPLASAVTVDGAVDHVSMTKEAALNRAQHLEKKKPLLLKNKKKKTKIESIGSNPDSNLNQSKSSVEEDLKGSFTSLLFPGATPEVYHTGDRIPIFVEFVESRKTQLPVKYFKMPGVCMAPSKEESKAVDVKIKRKNLGQRLMGTQSTQLTSYTVKGLQNTKCTPLCQSRLDSKSIKFLQKVIKNQYRISFTMDNLPIIVRSKSRNYALRGFPIGFKHVPSYNKSNAAEKDISNANTKLDQNDGTGTGTTSPSYYIYNHLRFVIYYNDAKDADATLNNKGFHITGFDVVPVSIQQDMQQCNNAETTLQNKIDTFQPIKTDNAGNPIDVLFSYEVTFQHSEITWADRWDIYMMESPDNEIHYFAIVNSLMIAFLLTGVVAVIMVRALKKDIAQYNDLNLHIGMGMVEDGQHVNIMEETGWKLVHGDVFRPPTKGRTLLSVCVGTGLQIGTSVFLTLMAAAMRFLNPMRKGQTLSYVVVLYMLSGSVAGFSSAKLYKFFHGKAWKRTTLLTAAAFPGVLFTLFVALNFFLHLSLGKASASASFWTMLLMFLLWVCVSAPLVFIGAFFGYKASKIEVPTKTTQIARFIPDSNSWFVKFPHCALLAGILPFASVAIELSFIMNALWINQIYYIMGFLIVVCFVFTLSCSTMAMVMCYCQLCNENHRWWWKSFFNGASTGFYLFLYSIWYLIMKLELVGILSLVVYISYMGLICFAFSLYCGGIALISSFWFCNKIYAAVKVE